MHKIQNSTILGLALLLSACQIYNMPPAAAPTAFPSAVTDPNDLPGSQATPLPIATAPPDPVASPTAGLPADLGAIRLTTDNRHFSSKGESMRMHVILLDTQGHEIQGNVPLRWWSTRPDSFSVDADGQVTALVEYGFADIVVQVPDTRLESRLLVSVNAHT